MRNQIRRSSVFIAVFALLAVLFGATPAQASQALCGSYGDMPSFGCVSYSGFTGQQPWGYPVDSNGHNCTNYVTYRLWQNGASNPGNLGNAYQWDERATQYGIPVNGTPAVGSVAVWEINSGPALGTGHVAYVEAVTSSYIDISEDNYGGTTMRKRFFVGQSDWPDHFVHVKDLGNGTAQINTLTSQITSGGVQHVYFGTLAGKVHETWWVPGSNPPSTGTLETTGGSSVTAMSSQITSGNTQHVYWGTSSGKVYETWWNSSSPVDTELLFDTGGSEITALSSQVTPSGYQHVYFGTASGKVYEVWWGNGLTLTPVLLSQTGGSSVTAMSSQLTNGNTQHVYWGTSSGIVYETWWSPTSSSPSTGQLTTISGTSITAMSSQLTGSNIQHVYFGTASGKVYEVWWGGGNPVSRSLIDQTAGPRVTAISSQVTGSIQHVYWGTSYGKVYESWFGGGNPVSTTQLYDDVGEITAMSSSITGTNTNHVYFGSSTGLVYETWWVPGGGSPSTGQLHPN